MRSPRRGVPSFALYGESPGPAAQTDGVHIEDIPSRSRKYLWRIGTHRHTLLSQCVMVTCGPVTVTLDETRAVLAGPVAMIIPAGSVHGFRFRADTQGYVLTVDLARMLGMAAANHRAPIEALFCESRILDLREDTPLAERIERLMERLALEFKQPDSSTAPIGGWLACGALWALAHGTGAHGTPELHGSQEAARLRRFRQMIETQYLNHRPVSHYARQLSVSETTLNRLCRALAGTTAFDLIQRRLGLEARRRLVYAASSVNAIAAELGFKDPAYFSRFFRRHSGISPNEFRRRHHGG
jgi:AraC family transcriptional regulator, transcriptional activator of pobA